VTRRLLVVTYHYPPLPSVGVNRWLSMSKYLRRAGFEVEIVTTAAFGSLSDDEERHVHRAYDLVGAGWLRRGLRRPPLPGPGEEPVEDIPPPAVVTKLFVPDHCAVTWLPAASASTRRLLARKQFDCIVTTSPFESAHLIPLLIRGRRPAWVADFRDGWTFLPWRPTFPMAVQRRLDRALERRVVESAERTACVQRPVADDLHDRLGVDAAYVPNGWDPELTSESEDAQIPVLDDGRKALVFTGKLRGRADRDPTPLLEALRRLRSESPTTAEQLELVIAGRLDRDERELLESFALGGLVRHVGHLSRAQSLALQRHADALIVITAPGVVWELPGKLLEYLGSGRPILALAAGNEAARLVTETGTGVAVPPTDVEAIVAALRLVASGELAQSYAPRSLEQYAYPQPAERMAGVIEDAIRRHADRR
jgi:glycosyltransferase involved in cell wall biosynthesis